MSQRERNILIFADWLNDAQSLKAKVLSLDFWKNIQPLNKSTLPLPHFLTKLVF